MLVIRLRRVGKKNKPTYRVVVAEHTYPVNGKFTADLGFYNPHSKAVGVNKEEIMTWLNKGAKPSNTIARILEKEKVKHNSVVVVKKKKQPKKSKEESAPKASAVPAQTAPENEPVATEQPAEEAVVEEPTEAPEETPES